MSTLTDEELTKLAVEELLKDAKRFKDKRDAEFRATQMKRPMETNKPFLKNTLRDVLSFNKKKSDKAQQIVENAKKRKLQISITQQYNNTEDNSKANDSNLCKMNNFENLNKTAPDTCNEK